MVPIIGIFILIEIAGNSMSSGANRSSHVSDVGMRSDSAEILSDRSNTTAAATTTTTTTANQRSHSDLIRICSTFREILSEEVAYSCDYSMLYYKGQCELYSDLLKQNETEAILKAKNDLSFCSDSRLDTYIREHDLTNAPRSPTLIPNEGIPMA